jgi:hypothetical protein
VVLRVFILLFGKPAAGSRKTGATSNRFAMVDKSGKEQVARARALIELTRRELARLQDEIQSTRAVVYQARRLLLRTRQNPGAAMALGF